jgi:hypothetical protein
MAGRPIKTPPIPSLFSTLAHGGRVMIGGRSVRAVGKPVRIGSRKRRRPRLGPEDPGGLDWDAPVQQATLFIGLKKGKSPKNKRGECAVRPRRFHTESVDKWFRKLRKAQLLKHGVSATRLKAKGWYEGEDEPSLNYQIIFEPSEHEPDYKTFKEHMAELAENLSEHFCQDSVIIVTEDQGRRHAYGYSWDEKAPRLRAKKGKGKKKAKKRKGRK